jgi:diguanylate cyclase (GGDEF)-like protein
MRRDLRTNRGGRLKFRPGAFMWAEALPGAVTQTEDVRRLFGALGAAQDARELLRQGWTWFNDHVTAEALSVMTRVASEPSAYLFAAGPLQPETESQIWNALITAAGNAAPDSPPSRRATDRIKWAAQDRRPLPPVEPVVLGEWPVAAGGELGAIVQLSRVSTEPSNGEPPASAADAATLIGLYALSLHSVKGQIVPQTSGDLTFEELLEEEVARAHRTRTPVSLVLVELRKSARAGAGAELSREILTEAQHVTRKAARRGDRVLRLCDDCLAVVMPKTDARGALVGADRLQQALSRHFGHKEIRLTIRIGVGGRDPRETEASELFSRACQALAQARLANSQAAFLYV